MRDEVVEAVGGAGIESAADVESTRHAFATQNVNGADGLREPQLNFFDPFLEVGAYLVDGFIDVVRA